MPTKPRRHVWVPAASPDGSERWWEYGAVCVNCGHEAACAVVPREGGEVWEAQPADPVCVPDDTED